MSRRHPKDEYVRDLMYLSRCDEKRKRAEAGEDPSGLAAMERAQAKRDRRAKR